MDDWLDPLRSIKRKGQVTLEKALQRARFGRVEMEKLPRLFGNAIPKSGSHLLYQFLEGLTRLAPFVMRHRYPVRTYTRKGRRRSEAEILADLRRINRGEIGWGYLFATEANMRTLADPSMVVFQIVRDPRDKIISQILYALDIYPGHRMRQYYQDHLDTMEQRIEATIAGVKDDRFPLADIRTVYQSFLPWLQHPRVMPVRFEELISEPEETLDRMLDHLQSGGYQLDLDRAEAIQILIENMAPGKSATFRAGKIGSWRDYFSSQNKRLFKQVAGQLLIDLGYENSNEW